MAVNWGSIASQMARLGLGNLAQDAVRYGAEAEKQRRADIQRQVEREQAARNLAGAGPSAAPRLSALDVRERLKSMSPDELDALWKMFVPALSQRAASGELSEERAAALKQIIADFDRARALPDLQDRTMAMRRVMGHLGAAMVPEPRP